MKAARKARIAAIRCFICGRPLGWHTKQERRQCERTPLRVRVWDVLQQRWVG